MDEGKYSGRRGRRQKGKKREPTVKIKSMEPDEIQFWLEDTHLSVANSLRRAMIAEVPTMAIDSVKFHVNTSAFHNEFLAHRLGLVPFRCPAKVVEKMKYSRECTCGSDESCDECAFKVVLAATNETSQPLVVTSHDLVMMKSVNDFEYPSPEEIEYMRNIGAGGMENEQKQQRVLPVHYSTDRRIMLFKLGSHQSVKLEAIIRKGIGKDHAKWIPVATATFQCEPKVRLNQNALSSLSSLQKQEFAASCPTKVFQYEKSTGGGLTSDGVVRVAEGDHLKCMLCMECVHKAQELNAPNIVSVGEDESRFLFTVESTGCMPAVEIVRAALTQLKNKLDTLSNPHTAETAL